MSRRESAKLILRVIANTTTSSSSSIGGAGPVDQTPVFLAGDLNSEPDDECYQILNAANSTLQDVKELSSWHYGNKNTFTGFQDSTRKTEIDHVFVGPRGGEKWTVKGYSVVPNRFEDGVYSSDHEAVVGDVVLVG